MIRGAHRLLPLWAVVTISLLACTNADPKPPAADRGAGTRETLVAAYLMALAARDGDALITLTDPVVDARADIVRLVETSGGTRVSEPTFNWRDEFGGTYVIATVTGTDTASGRLVSLTIPISRKANRFFLALGQADLRASDSVISSPLPTSR